MGASAEKVVRQKWCLLQATMDERARRLWSGTEAGKTVAKLLRDHGYSWQAPNKSVEGAQHPDRNAQFEHINAKAQEGVDRGVPVISVDTKKKELVGNFKNGGREWQPKGRARPGGRPRLPVRCSRQSDPIRRL